MTVQAQKSTQYYNGPISAGTVLSIVDFTFIDNSHVSAKIRNNSKVWEYGTDYTVVGAGTLVRQITILKEVLAGEVLAVYLDVPITQTVAPEEGGKFPAAIQEFTLDKLTYICQMLQERISRSLQVSIDSDFDGTLPEAIPNRTFKINEAGTGLVLSQYDPDQALVITEDFKKAAEEAAQAAKDSEVAAEASKQSATKSAASAEQVKNEVDSLKQDTQIIANTARDWATKLNGKVEDIDYSAKYYAQKAAATLETYRLPLFYRVVSDYILTGAEAKGKLLQGSLVTNLYPDAIAHVGDDYTNGTESTFTYGEITFPYIKATDGHNIVDIQYKDNVDQLFSTTGIAEFYIWDNENEQFYLPRNNWFDQYTDDTSKVNEFNEAGLPDHYHKVGAMRQAYAPGSGNNAVWADGTLLTTNYASVNNPIYGKSNTVQPPSSNKLLYFVVGNTYVNQEDIDIAQVESELNNKLNLDCSNASYSADEYMSSMSMPDGSKIIENIFNSTVTTTGQTYTAPSDGVVMIGNITTTTVFMGALKDGSDVSYIATASGTSANAVENAWVQVAKGDKVKINTGSGTTNIRLSRFTPTKGANNV